MLRPIPARIMRSCATVRVCTGTDRYRKPEYDTYTVEGVHLQPTSEVRKTRENTEVSLRGLLFADGRRTRPALEWDRLLKTAEENGGDMKVTVRETEYTVAAADALRDDTDSFHHWEIALV